MGIRESLNGWKNIYGTKKSKERRSLLFFVPYIFSARLDFPLSPLSAPGSPRMFSSVDTHLPRFEALAYDLPHFDALTHVVIFVSLAFIFQRFAEV